MSDPNFGSYITDTLDPTIARVVGEALGEIEGDFDEVMRAALWHVSMWSVEHTEWSYESEANITEAIMYLTSSLRFALNQ